MNNQPAGERWQRVKQLFHDALERHTDDRDAYLAAACGADDGLRAEVERLLRAHADAAAFIEHPAPALSGRRIGRYEVGERVGAGGMGEVYVARDVDLGRTVALKVGFAKDTDPRLRREAQHASRLNHPNICTIHEIGSFDGRLYIAMEYVEGQPLSALIPGTGLPIDDVVRYATQIASALAHAHRQGVVHRDLKGSNVVVTPDGRAKLLDFGLARLLDATRTGELSSSGDPVTGDGLLAGTPAYMAPELLRGEPPSVRSDIWAFGVLLHQMAGGARPFAGATPFELSAAVLHDPPAPLPSTVPRSLRSIVERCLEKDPSRRYETADELEAALAAVRSADGLDGTAGRPRARTPWMAAAIAGALLVLGTAVVVGWRQWRTTGAVAAIAPAGRPAIAVMAFESLGGDADAAWLSKGVQSMLLTGLAQTRGLDIVSTQRLHEVARETGRAPLESLDRVQASEVARRAGARAAVVGSILSTGPTLRVDAQVEDLSSGRVLAAASVSGTDLFALVDQLAGRIRDSVGLREGDGARPVAEVSSASLEAYRLYTQGVDAFDNLRLDEATALLSRAVAIDPAFAEAYLQLALVSGPAGQPRERSSYLRKAAGLRDRLSEPRRLLMEVEVARDEGRFRDAAQQLDRLRALFPALDAIATLAVQLHAPVVGPIPDAEKLVALTAGVVAANPASTVARNAYAYALGAAGRFDDAVRELETYARLAPREPNPYDSLGELQLLMGRPERAIESFTRALTIDPAFARGGRAWALAILGRYEDALREAGSPPYLGAVLLARVGRYREASDAVEAAIPVSEAGGDVARAAALRVLRVLLGVERGQYAGALEDAKRAEGSLARVPEDRRRFLSALLALTSGVAESRRGRIGAARRHLDVMRQLYATAPASADRWWEHLLAGEIALAEGDLATASAEWVRARPVRRAFFSRLAEGSVLSNDLVFRDGAARLARARGDIRGAIVEYRRLLTHGPDQPWVALFEPRYVLELGRLLEQAGDRASARDEYRRFLQLWSRADSDLPELAEAKRSDARLSGQAAR